MPGARASADQRRRQILEAALRVAVRQGVDQITVRAVAAEAGLSSGLVFFHFANKDTLLLGLLDELLQWLITGDPENPRRPPTTFAGLIRSEVSASRQERERSEALLQFWVLGLRNPAIRQRIRAALKHYQALFLQAARATLADRPELSAQLAPEALAGLSVALVLGGEIASLMQPSWFDQWRPHLPLAVLLGEPDEQ